MQSTLLRVLLYLPYGQASHDPCLEYLPASQLLTVHDLGPGEALVGVVMCVGHVWHLCDKGKQNSQAASVDALRMQNNQGLAGSSAAPASRSHTHQVVRCVASARYCPAGHAMHCERYDT